MDWKREAIDKLKYYEAKQNGLTSAQEEVRRLEEDYTRIRTAATDAEPVVGGGGQWDGLINNIAQRMELKRAIQETTLWLKQMDRGLAVLDKEERRILERFYIHRAKGNVDRLCEELSVEQATVYRRRDSALRRFTVALYGVTET